MITMVDESAGAVEAMLTGRSLNDVARVLAAIACVDAEDRMVDSTRATMPVFQGEPWI